MLKIQQSFRDKMMQILHFICLLKIFNNNQTQTAHFAIKGTEITKFKTTTIT